MVPLNAWRSAPRSAYIVGLKELPENDSSPLEHTHIFFAHCYKQQGGWKDVLGRFVRGNGLLLDLEFLTDEHGRRVAAFGYHAGFAGTAVGLMTWCHQLLVGNDVAQPRISPYPNESVLLEELSLQLKQVQAKLGLRPKVLVMGALGRCGTGACDFARRVGIPEEDILKWCVFPQWDEFLISSSRFLLAPIAYVMTSIILISILMMIISLVVIMIIDLLPLERTTEGTWNKQRKEALFLKS